MYKKIFKEIKKHKDIVIARHIGPDPDCLASQMALKSIILKTFPNKNVFVVGVSAVKFNYFGKLDKITEEITKESLVIVLDTPDKGRIDSINPHNFNTSIKIDHHPFVEEYACIEWIDDKASSVSQMLIDLCFNTKLEMTKEAAELLYMGVVSDTNRFMYYYTTPHTFELISKLVKMMDLNITELYDKLYLRPLSEIRLQGYIGMNMVVSENKLGYTKLTSEIISEFKVDSASAGNMINNFNHIKEVLVWMTMAEDTKQGLIRVAIRSRGPIVNELAAEYGGGGHIYASGVRFKTWEEADIFIEKLDNVCKKYIEENE